MPMPTPSPSPSLPIIGQTIVVAFDLCSSSEIVDDLTKTGDVRPLITFFTDLRRHLAKEQKRTILFDLYKFTGDGWLLLFPANTDGESLLSFLENLSLFFAVAFRRCLLPHLSRKPGVVGITFGIEKGELVRIMMDGQQEYVGRAINVACRLQGALKDKGGPPGFSALVSNRVYADYFSNTTPHRVHKVTRRLRNIDGGSEFACRRLWLVRPFQATDGPS